MVLPDRIELSTSPLPMECSTTELRQHARELLESALRPLQACRFLPQGPRWRKRVGRVITLQKPPRSAPASIRSRLLLPGSPSFGQGDACPSASPCSTRQCISVVQSFILHLRAFERGRHEGRSGQTGTAGRRRREGFTTGPAEAGAARKSQAAEVAGARTQRGGGPVFRYRGCLPR